MACKRNPTRPDEPEELYIDVEIKYQRVDDNLNCPRLRNKNVHVYVDLYASPLSYNEELEEIGEDLYRVKIEQVRVNYPKRTYHFFPPYEIVVIDNVFFDPQSTKCCDLRAHIVWINGYLMQKIHKQCSDGEYLLVRFDKDGVPHEVDS
jgi:hypothetical protein